MAEATKLAGSKHRLYDAFGSTAGGDQEVGKRPSGDTFPGNSVLITAAVIISDTLGAGLLSMSAAVATLGWLLGGALIMGMLALNVHLCMILWRLKMEFPNAHTLGELAQATFSRGPRWQQSLVRRFVDQVQYVFIFFMLAADATSFGKGFALAFYDLHLCLPVWVLIGSALLLPVHALTRTFGGNRFLILFNCTAVLGCVAVCMHHFIAGGASSTRPAGSEFVAMEPLSIMGILNGLNIMTFNFTIQFMIVEIVSEMESPAQFPLAMWGCAYPFLAILFVVCGVGGYYFLGNGVHGLMISHMPFGMPLRLTAACLIIFVLVAYLLKSVLLCRACHNYCDPLHAEQNSPRSEAGYTVTIVLMMLAAFVMSQVVPFFTPFIDFIGATLAPLCCIAIPLVMYVQWNRTFHSSRITTGEAVLMTVELVLCMVVMTLGTYDSLLTIVSGWEAFGSPFSCHCEHLWNTCGCSAANLGKEVCMRQAEGVFHDPSATLPFSEVDTLASIRRGLWWY